MKKLIHFVLFLLFLSSNQSAYAQSSSRFSESLSSLPKKIEKKMKTVTWRKRYPLSLDKLSYLQVAHWGFDHKIHEGGLIVQKDVAKEVLSIFKEVFEKKFPIGKMELASRYHGDDNASMQANNTSAFNCRAVTGRPGVFSKHNYRRAIDNNTIQNPYVNGDTVLPKTESRFLDRSKRQSGLIQANGVVVQAFNKSSWKWGGNWTSLKDYQHFEKH